jgi:hypothetical protein
VHLADVLDACLVQGVPAAEPVEQFAAQLLGTALVAAGPKQDGEETCIAHGVGTMPDQLFAWPFLDRPLFDGDIGAFTFDADSDLLAYSVAPFLAREVQSGSEVTCLRLLDARALGASEPYSALGPHGIHGLLHEICQRVLVPILFHFCPLRFSRADAVSVFRQVVNFSQQMMLSRSLRLGLRPGSPSG